ncbi:hypothetical protein EON81_07240 [bacterium]|nr:MAG: hypothetical protein EON81_07240 [bacterium]
MRDPITGQLVAGYSNRDPFTGQLVRLGRRRPIAVGIWEDMPLERTAIATAGNYYVSRGQFRNTSGRKLGSLRLVYPGTVRANGAPVEYGLGNDYTATAAFEYTSSQGPMVQDGTRPLVTFTGGLGGLVPNGGHRLSDPAPFEIEAGAYAYVRSGMTVGTNGHFVPTGAACQGLATDFGRGTGDGVQTAQANNAAVYDGGAAITITNQVLLGFRPLVVTDDSDGLTCAVFVGDSNQAGSPDAEKGPRRGGWGVRSAEINGCSAMRLAMSGDRAEWVAKHSSSFGRRQLWRYGTHGVLDTNPTAGKACEHLAAGLT